MLDRRLALGGLLAVAFTAGLALLAIAAVSFDWHEGARAQSTSVIEVGDNWFCNPSFQNGVCETTVNVGDTVQWQWVGSVDHTTTACIGSDFATCDAAQGWDSPVQSGGSFTQNFTTAGTFYYKCLIHPGPSMPFMRGQVIVLAAEQPTPTPSPTPTPPPIPTQPPILTPSPTPAEVPTGGGPPAGGPGTLVPWWPFLLASGGLLISAAIALALRAARPT